jgi:hypothetical protein
MTLHILDEIIDAIIRNEGRQSARPGAARPRPWPSPAKWACRPDWMQEPPGEGEDKGPSAPWPRHLQYTLTRRPR